MSILRLPLYNPWFRVSTARIIEGRLVHYSLQAYSMFGVYIIYSFIIYRVRHKWVLCAPQICISFLWLACKKIWWAVANFGGKFKQSMLLWHKLSWVVYKTLKNWDLNLSTKFSSWKSKKCYEQTLEQDRDLIECFSVKRRSENSLESVKIEDDIAAPNQWVFFCEKEAWEYLEWWVKKSLHAL